MATGSSSRGRWVWAAATALLWVGCSFEEGPQGPALVNECASDEDCGAGRCDPEHGLCVASSSERMTIGVEVLPIAEPGGGDPVRSTFEAVPLDGPMGLDLGLQPRSTVVGVVRYLGEPVPAELVFERQSLFPGGPMARVRATTADAPTLAEDGLPSDYSARVAAGSVYRVEAQPIGEARRWLPPLRMELPILGETRADIEYPGALAEPCARPAATGCTFRGQVLSAAADGSQTPEDGLQVRAIDAETGATISSTALTGTGRDGAPGSPGSFELVIGEASGPFVLVVTAGETRPFFPSVTVDPGSFFSDFTPRIVVPRLDPVRFVASVEDSRAQGVGAASLAFHSRDVFDAASGISGSFRTVAETAAPTASGAGTSGASEVGRFEVELLPGNYEVVITPPGNDLGVLVGELYVPVGDAPVQGQVFVVPDRSRLGGFVQTSDGQPLTDALVRATRLGDHLEQPEARHSRSSDTASDATGRFDLPLDVGCYDLSIRPQEGARMPWIVAPDLRIAEPDTIYEDELRAELPVLVEGTVSGPDGAQVAGAEVRAYAIVRDDLGGDRAVQIGQATSDEQGRYLLLLPPRLQ